MPICGHQIIKNKPIQNQRNQCNIYRNRYTTIRKTSKHRSEANRQQFKTDPMSSHKSIQKQNKILTKSIKMGSILSKSKSVESKQNLYKIDTKSIDNYQRQFKN
jgi:carbonic anhydrase